MHDRYHPIRHHAISRCTKPSRPQTSPIPPREVVHVQHLEAGEGIGYGSAHITPEPDDNRYYSCRLYADGYPRSLSNRGTVLIQGTRCPVVGSYLYGPIHGGCT